MEERVTIAGMKPEATENLTHRIELAIGMLVMVTFNIATEADLANGSRGVIEDIVLDPRERVEMADLDDEGVVWLQYPPAMVLFRPFHFEFQPFPGLDPGLIPIFPSEVHFTIHTHENPSSRVHRRQYPMTAAYAFTDHKAQGQTIEFVIVDIGRVKRFPVTPFAAYVALSRSRGRQSIRLLRDFDKNIFTSHPSEDLRVEDHRLNELDRETKEKFKAGFYNF
jgi:ATP-dependent exoDNAse (exonuclease V) alpha subunit